MRIKLLMKKSISMILTFLMIVTCINVPVFAQSENMTQSSQRTIQINRDWKFYLGTSSQAQNKNFDDSSWKDVNLPHDFSISQSFTTSGEAESGFLPGGTGWYRKSLTFDSSYTDKTVVLNFDGVYSDAYVYVNGQYIGEHHYGYTSFAFDISDYIVCDGSENVIAVKAVNNIPSSRWYSGSGIYRDVSLIVSDQIHVAYQGTYVTTPNIKNGDGTVQVVVDVDNDSDENTTVTVKNSVYKKNQSEVLSYKESTVSVDAKATQSVTNNPVVSSPQLWSVDSPQLYVVKTEIIKDGQVIDTYDTEFGFRYYEFNDSGFFLNGKAVKLNGVCLHHDQGALGSAAYDDAIYRQLMKMKDMGVNAIRTSHNPADEDFINMCNELGFVVIEEAFDGWSVSKNGNSNDFGKYFNTSLTSDNHLINGSNTMSWSEFAIKSMVRRDQNDPAVILWSLGNEIQEGASADSSYPTVAQNLINWIKELDTTRPSTIGSNQRTTSGTLGSVHSVVKNNGGIVGFNYASANDLSSMHSTYGPIIASETSSAVNSRSIYTSQASASNADGKYHLTSYDTSAVSWGMSAHDSLYNTYTKDYVAGEFVWTGFDYIGEPTPWNGTGSGSVSGAGALPNSSYFGIVDTAGFEKDTYYFYRSQWNQKDTTLHLVTAWDEDNMLISNGKTPVVVYSNAPKVELYRNGTLIACATRQDNVTNAGHHYYTYTTESKNTNVCSAVNGSGSSSLYASFQVVYESGTISAKAYDENGQEITDIKGNASVSTPGEVTQLKVTQDKTEIDADGNSLAYLEVEVLDDDGYLDTTATNQIQFQLSGNGEIAGVDNGDQATTEKYQQSSVLTSSTSAQIKAFGGKALVIVRSTTKSGNITVDVSSDGLTGKQVSLTTKKVIASKPVYDYKKDYSVKVNQTLTLETSITRTIDDEIKQGTIDWDDESLENDLKKAGNYTIQGKATFEDETISVSANLHVIDEIIAMRNISTATPVETIPVLPETVKGIVKDGTISDSAEFSVVWDSMQASDFDTVGEIVTVQGTATVIGDETLPVTASVRVAETISGESSNVARNVSHLTQDIEEDKQSDNLDSLINGTTKPGDNTSERWTNWNNRTTSDHATLTMKWDTAQLLSHMNLYYYYDNCCAKPESVSFAYSLNGTDFTTIDTTENLEETYNLGAQYSYTFEKVINPVAIRITLTQQDGTTGNHCVGLTEVEAMSYSGSLEYQNQASLSSILVDNQEIESFQEDIYEYNATGSKVEALSIVNAGITVLPEYNHIVSILTVSEDGSDERKYSITLSQPCLHEHTQINNVKEATCQSEGYTGDTVCVDCGEIIIAGIMIPQLEHQYDSGVITKEATESETGIKTYTCLLCHHTKEEVIPKLPSSLLKPTTSVFAKKATTARRITLIGQFDDYAHQDQYVSIVEHGLVYYSTAKLGTRTLTVNTPGRTKVKFGGYNELGQFQYTMTPTGVNTPYTVRSYLAYIDESGRTVYIYSSAIKVTYNTVD